MIDDTTTEDIYVAIGTVVTRLLKPDQPLTVHEIINELHRMAQNTEEPDFVNACREAIKFLARLMH